MLRDFFSNEGPSPIDPLIDALQDEMHTTDLFSDEYQTLLSRLERLYEIKAKERQDPLSRDTVLMVAGNLFGILTIVAYEQKHLMSQKGFSQLLKLKQ